MDWKYLQKDENLFISVHSFQFYDYPIAMILSRFSSKEQYVGIYLSFSYPCEQRREFTKFFLWFS